MTPTARPVAAAFMRLDQSNNWGLAASPASAALVTDVVADRELGGLRLGRAGQRSIPFEELGGSFGGLTLPTGLAIGPDNRIIVADPGANRLLGYTTVQAGFLPLWHTPAAPQAPDDLCQDSTPQVRGATSPYLLSAPRGVAFSADGDLVVADTGQRRIIVYTWPALAVRKVIQLPMGEPWDIAYDGRGRLYVADALAGRVHRFDRLWRADSRYVGGAGTLQHPRHLAFDADDTLYVVDEGLRRVVALDERGRVRPDFDPTTLSGAQLPLPLTVDESGRVALPSTRGAQCPGLLLAGVTVDRTGRLPGSGAMLLARPAGILFPRRGEYISSALDSNLFNCPWHRIVLDADIPETTTLSVQTLTHAALLEAEQVSALPEERWSRPLALASTDIPEVLVQSGPGRYLWIRLKFGSGGAATPLVRAQTIYAPRHSSRSYLPPVFQEDTVSADFLDRFLSYFDTVFAEIETTIEEFTGYLDPDATPSEFLPWLGSWFDLEFLAASPDTTRRALIRQAIHLYRQRGTVAGIQAMLRLQAGLQPPYPVIVEHFRLRDYAARRGGGGLVDGKLYMAGLPLAPIQTPAGNEIAHHFTVVVPEQAAADADARATLERLIDAQKPAHTRAAIRVVKAGLRIGCQSTVGVDTLIGTYPQQPVGELLLGHSSRLAGAEAAPASYYRIGVSRLNGS